MQISDIHTSDLILSFLLNGLKGEFKVPIFYDRGRGEKVCKIEKVCFRVKNQLWKFERVSMLRFFSRGENVIFYCSQKGLSRWPLKKCRIIWVTKTKMSIACENRLEALFYTALSIIILWNIPKINDSGV